MPRPSVSTCLRHNWLAGLDRTSSAKSRISATCRWGCNSPSRSWSAGRCSCFSSFTSSGAMASVTQPWTLSTPNPATAWCKQKRRAGTRRFHLLFHANLCDQAQNFALRHVVERAQIILFETLAQIFRGDKAGFAVGQVALALFTELHESSVRQPADVRGAVHEKLGVDGVRVPGGDPVPHVREAALVCLASQLRSHFEGADELAHGAGIREYGACRQAISLFFPRISVFKFLFLMPYLLTAAAASTWLYLRIAA